MSRKETGNREARGVGSTENRPDPQDDQRDPGRDVQHMPRHWQASGTRGEAAGQPPPKPDEREVARGNQYGTAGRVASEQVHADLTEHGREPAPQRRDNAQQAKRPGERPEDLPTPEEGKEEP